MDLWERGRRCVLGREDYLCNIYSMAQGKYENGSEKGLKGVQNAPSR